VALDVEGFLDGNDIPHLENIIRAQRKHLPAECVQGPNTNCQLRAFIVVGDEIAVNVLWAMWTGDDSGAHQAYIVVEMCTDVGFDAIILDKDRRGRGSTTISFEKKV
jgi:hypothetical protein